MAKTALIWGAAGDIGRAIASKLKADGWHIIAVSRQGDDLGGLADYAVAADVADPFAVQCAAVAIGQEAGEAGLFVYAAGDITAEPAAKMAPPTFRRILDANLTGAYNTYHFSQPLLTADAPLVFIGAVSERMRLPGLSAYAAAKAGLEAFAEALRKEERKRQVIVVRPGAVRTKFWQKVPFKMPGNALAPEQVAERIVAAIHSRHEGQLDIA
ncbi:MAG: SDR family NAD(P)-dependent oxidoreductase [Anaerolineae bacterium]|nr:SDR family NAD(P)-dependent oxidoreductase [Anaerolineae bacterium]